MFRGWCCKRQSNARRDDISKPFAVSVNICGDSAAQAKRAQEKAARTTTARVKTNSGLVECLGGFSCFGARESASPEEIAEVKFHSASSMEAQGVPKEAAEGVAKLADALHIVGPEPLSDPLTLLRFFNARDGDLQLAAQMYRDAVAWRASFSIHNAMMTHGSGEQYSQDGRRVAADVTQWCWRRGIATRDAQLVQSFGFWGRLSEPAPADGEPVAIWRLGACDIAGYVREDVVDIMVQGFAAHLEDLLQASRALSRAKGRLIRCRMIIDLQGLGSPLAMMKHRAVFKRIMGLGKSYYPEVNASVTIVRAPSVFSKIFAAAKPSLTPVMQRKISILGDDFEAGLRAHAGIELSALPKFLGGDSPDDQVGACAKLPQGLSKK